MNTYGFAVQHRFKIRVTSPSGEYKEHTSQWSDYWNHKVYHHKSIAEEAIKAISSHEYFFDHEFRIVELFSNII